MKKERLDVLVTERGLAESRTKAQALIMSGQVYVNGQKEEKSGTAFPQDAVIEVRGSAIPYVSRGGLKLEKALRVFDVGVQGKTCMDVGASTGGFTDCMLQNGAAKVYAVDVGYGQFSWKLRQDPRVVNLERTNLRYLTREQVPETVDLAVMDVSFISIRLILPVVRDFLAEEGDFICLIKPQFEAGREQVGKKGVVRDPQVHCAVIENCLEAAQADGYTVHGLDFSPIRGPEGNIEFLCHLKNGGQPGAFPSPETVVAAAHQEKI